MYTGVDHVSGPMWIVIVRAVNTGVITGKVSLATCYNYEVTIVICVYLELELIRDQ